MSSSSSSSFLPLSPSSPPSLEVVLPRLPARQCLVCSRPAYCNNYGALTCDACKMFFRRVIVENLKYTCRWGDRCFDGLREESVKLPRCKACRFRRCLQIGMEFVDREKKKRILELRNHLDDDLAQMLAGLLYLDAGRARTMATCFTESDPSMEDIIAGRFESATFPRRAGHIMRPQDWSFFALFTTVGQHLKLDFMHSLTVDEKKIVLKKCTGKTSLFSGAMRTFKEQRDRLMTVDGKDIYPDHIKTVLRLGDDEFLNRIRSLLVSRVIELKVTSEEYVLLNAILVSNPALEDLPERACSILDAQRQKYSSALLQYCLLSYQREGPSRFADLLSLFHVISRNFDDVQYLTIIFKLALQGAGLQYKKLVEEII